MNLRRDIVDRLRAMGEPVTAGKLGAAIGLSERLTRDYLKRWELRGAVVAEDMKRPKGGISVVWRATALALVLAGPAQAQTLQHPPHGAHDPFLGMKQPGNGRSCCDGQDCATAKSCVPAGGGIGWQENGGCWALPEDKLTDMPPELAHSADLVVCRTWSIWNGVPTPHVLCWAGGAGT